MGNRANVVFVSGDVISPAVYLHWNGGPESVYAFLAEMDFRGIRTSDPAYEAARFTQIVGEFMDKDGFETTSVGITNGPSELTTEGMEAVFTDAGDNGFYVTDRAEGTMRRWTGFKLEEWQADMVAEEKARAEAHDYASGIAEAFREMAPGKRPR